MIKNKTIEELQSDLSKYANKDKTINGVRVNYLSMSLLQQQTAFYPSHPLVTRTQIKQPIKQI